jgi:hypothetical protein
MRKIAIVLVVLVAAGGLASAARAYLAEGIDRAQEQLAGRPVANLTDLRSIDQFKVAFAEAEGMPRLILLLSPT